MLPSVTTNQSIITEVTEFKEKEEELRVLAQTDSLTGLSNKAETVALSEKILHAQPHALHAMMALDIDNFKEINDTYGHVFGDAVLVESATRLKQLFRAQDVIGMVGGDEFLVLMIDILSPEYAVQKAKEICAAFRNENIGEGKVCKISCSVGIALTTQGMCYDDLIRKADNALYQAKTRGKNQSVVYGEPGKKTP